MAMAALPQELIEDILSRLPVRSLLRFKSTSKNWYYLISKNHNFAKLQFQQSSSSASKNLIIIYKLFNNGAKNQYSYSDVDSSESRIINFTVERGLCNLIGSANGLICLAPFYEEGCCYIWNPCTEEHKRISFPGVDGSKLFGFGYDSIYDDYKIVGDWDSHLQIFSLKTNSWRKIHYYFNSAPKSTSLHSNGALHWWCVGHRKIIAFDLATYEILSLDPPEEIKFGGYKGPWVPLFLDYQGSLFASGHKSIWVMKEYGNTQSWAKLSTSLPKEDAKPISISRLGELVFRTADGLGLVKSDIEGRMSDDDKSRIIQFGSTFVFKESLISPVSIQKDDKLIGLALTDCN